MARGRLEPQVVVTPESAAGGIDGPRDCSAVVRLAYHGDDLYAQFLVFDDVVSFHQDVDRHYKQDGVEMCLNGFLTGFKFDATVTTDAGPDGPPQSVLLTEADLVAARGHAPRVDEGARRRPGRPRARADRGGLRRRHGEVAASS